MKIVIVLLMALYVFAGISVELSAQPRPDKMKDSTRTTSWWIGGNLGMMEGDLFSSPKAKLCGGLSFTMKEGILLFGVLGEYAYEETNNFTTRTTTYMQLGTKIGISARISRIISLEFSVLPSYSFMDRQVSLAGEISLQRATNVDGFSIPLEFGPFFPLTKSVGFGIIGYYSPITLSNPSSLYGGYVEFRTGLLPK